MSLVVDRRKRLGDHPGTHAFVCGTGRYPFAERMGLARELGLPSREPIALATAKRVQRWLMEHADDLAVPLATCRVLLSADDDENLTPPTLDEFLRAAGAWREDASTHPDGMTFLYIIAHGISLSPSEDALLLEDFGDSHGGLLHSAISIDSLTRGMAPTRWQSNIARNQLFFIDVIEPQEPVDLILGSQPSAVFDAPIGDVPDDRLAMTFRGATYHDAPPGPQGISAFADALLRCLDGDAGETLPGGQSAVTATGLAQTLPALVRERPGPRSSRREEVRIIGSVGSPSRQIVVNLSALPQVPVLVTFDDHDLADASFVVRDSNLTQIHSEQLLAGSRETRIELSPGLYLFELIRPGRELRRVSASVQLPQTTVRLVGQVRGKLFPVLFGNGNQALLSEAQSANPADIIARMGLAPLVKGPPVIVVCGGADDLTGAALERANVIIEAAVTPAAQITGAVLVDGGTAAGVMQLTGQARARWPSALPVLVGVAPSGLVCYPGGPEGDRVPLEENHSHFILANTSEWGGETRLLIAVAETLAGNGRAVVVLVGGGNVAGSEVLEAARRGWLVFAVAGTGGLADSLLELRTAYRVPRRRLAAAVLPRRLKYRPPPPLSAIADPDLREIVTRADIRPVTGFEPRIFARQLTWELQEEPVLKEAWQRFATFDYLAIRLRHVFARFQASILILGVLATLLALVDNQLKKPALHWAVVVVPILVSVLIAVASRRAFGQRWVMLRAAAESIKAAIYRYRTLEADPVKDSARTPAARQRQLASQLDSIESRLLQTEASSGPLTPYQGPLPPEMYGAARYDDGLSPLDADRYLAIRVRDQLTYFRLRVRNLNVRRNALQLIAIASSAAGAILAAAKLEVWIGLTAGLSVAALAYLAYLQVDNTIASQNQTASRLAALERGWRALSPAQQNSAAFGLLVTGCEAALAGELSGSVLQMNDSLQDLRLDQANAVSRIEPENPEAWRRTGRDSGSTS